MQAHLLLDTIVGDIWWFAPFIDKPFAFFTVPALYKPWWLNFLLHWSFALELAVFALAFYLLRNAPNGIQTAAGPARAADSRRSVSETHNDI